MAFSQKSLARWINELHCFHYSSPFFNLSYLVFYYPDFYYLILGHSIFIENSTKDEITLLTILLRFLVSTPLVAISLFGWSSIRLQRRLYEEYNHKQRVMHLYVSFTDEVEKVGTGAHKKELLTIMLKTVADKPTLAMNEKDKSVRTTFWQRQV